jgi:hypothetical protein
MKSTIEESIHKYLEESSKREDEREDWIRSFQEGTKANLKPHDETLRSLETKIELIKNDV